MSLDFTGNQDLDYALGQSSRIQSCQNHLPPAMGALPTESQMHLGDTQALHPENTSPFPVRQFYISYDTSRGQLFCS